MQNECGTIEKAEFSAAAAAAEHAATLEHACVVVPGAVEANYITLGGNHLTLGGNRITLTP